MALVTISMLSKINDSIAAALKRKLDANGVRNDATTTDAGYVLDARMGKTLGDRAEKLENKVGDLYFDTDSSGRWGYKPSKNGAVNPFASTGAGSSIQSKNLPVSKALVSDSDGKIAASSVTTDELGFLSGVTSSVQGQINALGKNIKVYVGEDGKIHFRDGSGADSVLNFSSVTDLGEGTSFNVYKVRPSSYSTYDSSNFIISPVAWHIDGYSDENPNRTMQLAWNNTEMTPVCNYDPSTGVLTAYQHVVDDVGFGGGHKVEENFAVHAYLVG